MQAVGAIVHDDTSTTACSTVWTCADAQAAIAVEAASEPDLT